MVPKLSNTSVVSPINEGDSTTLSGTVTDPDILDTFTLVVDWDDGSIETFNLPASPSGTQTFNLQHLYPDDDPTNTPMDDYIVKFVSLTDSDGGQAGTEVGGNIFLTGHDPDFHAQGNTGAQNLLRIGLKFATSDTHDDGNNPNTKFLWVESRISPPSGHRIGEKGLTAIGLKLGEDYDRANAAELPSVNFSNYTAIAVASSFGGLLKRVELDALIARKADIKAFINAGGGLFASSECDNCGKDLLGANPDLFGYLPINVSAINASAPFFVTTFGTGLGLVNSDLQSPTHNSFADSGGLNIVDNDNAGKPTTLAGNVRIEDDALTQGLRVTVDNVAPTVDAGPGATVDEGELFTSSGSFTDPGTDTWTGEVDYGDGGGFQPLALSGKTFSLSHTYGHADTYTVTVKIKDDDTGVGSDTLEVIVNNVAPEITFISASPDPVDEGKPVTVVTKFRDPSWLDKIQAPVVDCGIQGDLDSVSLNIIETNPPDLTGEVTAVCTYGHAGSPIIKVTVTDEFGASDDAQIQIKVNNVAPSIVAVGIPAPTPEGTPLTFSAKFTDPSWLDSHVAAADCGVNGDLDSVGLTEENVRPDSTGTITVVCTYGHAGSPIVTIKVKDDVGDSDSTTIPITVTNVAPTLSAITASALIIDEGQSIKFKAQFKDPSWLDKHFADFDCGDPGAALLSLGLTEENVRPDSTGIITAECEYGDNGNFTVKMTVKDDVGASDSQTLLIHVKNVNPGLTLDLTGTISFPGGDAFIGRKGVPQDHSATAKDPGSDDLTFNWDVGGQLFSNIHFNDGLGPDPFPSPGPTFPFGATDTITVLFSMPGALMISVQATDDDNGLSNIETAIKVVTDDCDCTKSQGFWQKQFSGKGNQHIDDATLKAYLDVVTFASAVFSEHVTANMLADADDIMQPGGPDVGDSNPSNMKGKAVKQAFAAWLNFAKGGVLWDEIVPSGQEFLEAMAQVEAIILDPNSTHDDYVLANSISEAINTMDKDNPECQDEGGNGNSVGRGKSKGAK